MDALGTKHAGASVSGIMQQMLTSEFFSVLSAQKVLDCYHGFVYHSELMCFYSFWTAGYNMNHILKRTEGMFLSS